MKWHLIAIFSLLLLLGYCAADGMIVMPDYSESVFMPEQKAVIFWDGSQEQLVIESKITVEDIASLAWLIPLESISKPSVEAADEQIFFELAELFAPAPKEADYSNILGLQTATGSRQGVEVVEQLKVDIYDVTILLATDADALIEWLNSNGYDFPEKFPNLLSDYVRSGNIYFIANKINLQNKYPGISPTSQDFECAQVIASDPWVGQIFYGGADEIESRIEYMIDDPRCAGASVEATAVLVSLRLGIATPLKITFTPSRPFYPMMLSSLNLGKGKALVYFVSDKPFKDSTGLFSTKNMLQFQGDYLSEYGVSKGSVITLLEWQGSYSSLEQDSFFVETPFVPELGPNFVPLHETIAEMLLMLLFFVIFLVLPLGSVLLLLPFVLGMLVCWVLDQEKAKKSFFFKQKPFAWAVSALIALAGPLLSLLLFALPMLFMFPEAGLDWYEATSMLSALGFIFLPYYVSMGCGLFFKRSKYKLRFALIPTAFFIAYFALILLFLTGSLFGIWPM